MDTLTYEPKHHPRADQNSSKDSELLSKLGHPPPLLTPTMASKKLFVFLAMASSSILWRASVAQTSGCTSAFLTLSPCLTYITGSEAAPTASCCSGLSSVVQTSPLCLCEALKGGPSQLGITVNQTLALQLPSACGVQTPPSSACDAASTPATPSATPSTNSTSSPDGSSSGKAPATRGPETGSSGSAPLSAGIVFLVVNALVAFAAI